MRLWTRALAITLPAVCLSLPAAADVSPAQVWEDLSGSLDRMGYEVSGDVAMQGRRLVVSDAVVDLPVPRGGTNGRAQFVMGTLGFTDQEDGTVRVELPAVMPVQVRMRGTEQGGGSRDLDLELAYRHDGLAIVASGEPGAVSYAFSARSVEVELTRLVLDGVDVSGPDARLHVTAGPVSGSTVSSTEDDVQTLQKTVKLGEVAYDLEARAPEGQGAGSVSGRLVDVESTSRSAQAVGGGATLRTEVTHGGGSMDFAVSQQGRISTGATRSAAGNLVATVSPDAAEVVAGARDLAVKLNSGGLPAPVDLTLDRMETTAQAKRPQPKGAKAVDLTLDATSGEAQIAANGAMMVARGPGGAELESGLFNVALGGIDGLVTLLGDLTGNRGAGAEIRTRMMLGMMAGPGSTGDTLRMQVELGADGGLKINGQRFR